MSLCTSIWLLSISVTEALGLTYPTVFWTLAKLFMVLTVIFFIADQFFEEPDFGD